MRLTCRWARVNLWKVHTVYINFSLSPTSFPSWLRWRNIGIFVLPRHPSNGFYRHLRCNFETGKDSAWAMLWRNQEICTATTPHFLYRDVTRVNSMLKTFLTPFWKIKSNKTSTIMLFVANLRPTEYKFFFCSLSFVLWAKCNCDSSHVFQKCKADISFTNCKIMVKPLVLLDTRQTGTSGSASRDAYPAYDCFKNSKLLKTQQLA